MTGDDRAFQERMCDQGWHAPHLPLMQCNTHGTIGIESSFSSFNEPLFYHTLGQYAKNIEVWRLQTTNRIAVV